MNFLYGVISLLLMGAIQISFSVYTLKHKNEWIERRIHIGNFGYNKGLILTNIITSIISIGALILNINSPEHLLNIILIPVAVNLAVWISIMSALTDIFSLKVPMDMAILGYWTAIPIAGIAIFITEDWLFTLVSILLFLMWAGVLYFFFGKGFGQADVRLLILYALTLSWWIGIDWVFYAFLAACIIQILFHFLSPSLKIGKRRAKGQYYNPNIDTIPVHVEVYPESEKITFDPVPKKKSFLPLVPALTTVYLGFIIVSLFLERNVCSAYDGLFCTIR